MKGPLCSVLLSFLCISSIHAESIDNSKLVNQSKENIELNYSTGAYASIEIKRPVAEVFKILTDVSSWPEINKGVTQKITPAVVNVSKNSKFKETISSPIPGIKDWTNEWTIEEFIPNRKFVISGLETFASVPIYSRITYEFKGTKKNETTFKRTIEVTLDKSFIEGTQKQEVEALYRFLGSQWEMANHLRNYVESK
ncbi:SRPBCC family protein [Acinetobacter sp. 187]|uniref:SRPBCC family protein n=1 Tax=Acinetobacter lanii TaxID=2715163 RepID=UPI001409E20A|nr:SRPBCC family protein [Acinetobacter lanii]NHC04997.1 SRPBCC family protein [Acinetobacter lanii]